MKGLSKVWIQNNSWQELEERRIKAKNLAIIPIGSTEQHGYHLPLGTDSMVANLIAEDAAEETNTVVAPTVWYGWCPHHMVLPGSITVRPEVLLELFYDIIKALHHHGFDKFVAINGHRIVNIAWMQIAAERAQRELGVKVVIFDPAYMSKDFVESVGYGPVGHAEEIESSHMLYKMPELVHMEKAVDNPVVPQDLYSVDPAYANDTLCYVPSTAAHTKAAADKAGGATGCPTKATTENGKLYHEHLIQRMVAVIKKLQG